MISKLKEIQTIENKESQTRTTYYEGSNISKVVHKYNNNINVENVLYNLCHNYLKANKYID